MRVGSTGSGVAERRRHRRFRVKQGALAFLGSTPGTIVDISEGGLTVHYVVLERQPAAQLQLDIFFGGDDFYLQGIPGNLITDGQTLSDQLYSSLSVKRLGIQFGELSSEQRSRLKYFILNNTVSET